MDKFNTLLQRFISNDASDQEVDEFMKLIEKDEYGEEVQKFLDQNLDEDPSEALTIEERIKALGVIRSRVNTKQAFNGRLIWLTAASLLLVAMSVWMYSKFVNVEDITQSQTAITIPGKDYVRLPDGSTVTLKEGSKLTYDTKSYGVIAREVTLIGEAFFDVAHDEEKPFQVHTRKVVTTVLGTAFNVNASSANQITVTVTRGKVAVGDDTRTYGTITPNEQIAVNTATDEFVKTSVDSQTAVQWKKDYFILDDITVAEAAELISKRYNVKVTIVNKSLNKCVINAWFLNNEGLQQVAKSVSAVLGASYTIGDKNNVTIEGGVGCN